MPAKAGTYARLHSDFVRTLLVFAWIPACAGMTFANSGRTIPRLRTRFGSNSKHGFATSNSALSLSKGGHPHRRGSTGHRWGGDDSGACMTSTVLADRSPIADPHLGDVATRVAALDWPGLAGALDAHGCATTGPLLTPEECSALRDLYGADEPFRSRIVMARHGFGRGEYKYFAYPAAWDRRGAADGPLLPAGGGRQPLERGNGHRGALPRRSRRLSGALPRGRPDTADAAAAAVRSGRLQLPASGRLRRARLPAAGGLPALAAGARISPAASSCSPSSARACSRAPRWCRSRRERP